MPAVYEDPMSEGQSIEDQAGDRDWTRRKLLMSAAGVAIAAPFLRGRRASTEAPYIIRYTSHVPRSHGLYTEGFVPFQKLVEEEMGDRLRLEGYMDKLLHGPLDGFKASVTGISDYTHAYAGYQPGSFQLLHALQLPFLFASPPVASLVAEELYPKHFKAEYERMGVYLAHYDTTSAYNIISRRPIRTLEDMQGIKMRVTGGLTAQIFAELGVVPVVMAAGETYTAFQRGILDAVALGASDMATYRLYEIGNAFTRVDVNMLALQYCLNRQTFDALPPDIKYDFYRLLRIRSQMPSQNYYAGPRADRAMETILDAGVELIELSEEENQRWRQRLVPLKERFIAENEALGLPAREVVDDLEQVAAQYANMTNAEILQRVTDHPVEGIIDF
jgi:TRAP-type C4-dicarboxylate transport system substrate-binding protein